MEKVPCISPRFAQYATEASLVRHLEISILPGDRPCFIFVTREVNRVECTRVQGVPQNVPRLCGYCRGAVDSTISVFTRMHRSSFNLEFETSFESI